MTLICLRSGAREVMTEEKIGAFSYVTTEKFIKYKLFSYNMTTELTEIKDENLDDFVFCPVDPHGIATIRVSPYVRDKDQELLTSIVDSAPEKATHYKKFEPWVREEPSLVSYLPEEGERTINIPHYPIAYFYRRE